MAIFKYLRFSKGWKSRGCHSTATTATSALCQPEDAIIAQSWITSSSPLDDYLQSSWSWILNYSWRVTASWTRCQCTVPPLKHLGWLYRSEARVLTEAVQLAKPCQLTRLMGEFSGRFFMKSKCVWKDSPPLQICMTSPKSYQVTVNLGFYLIL